VTDPEHSPTQAEPGHAFLDLGERLRHRGQLEAASSVALAGVARYPALAVAHDLVGRIRADEGDEDGARSAWIAALECDSSSLGALKGLAFLAFKRRDFAEAEYRLEAAAVAAPRDATILAALDRVRSSRPAISEEVINFDDTSAGLLLVDAQGLRLAGGTSAADDGSIGDAVSAETSSVIREAERAARLLGLGQWQHLLVEGNAARVALLPIDDRGSVVVHRPVAAPAGRMLAFAHRAVQAAEAWLGRHG
jgi:predicted regulator of Ras-like GTPase activity (Roadblock/LC7/MglB family)